MLKASSEKKSLWENSVQVKAFPLRFSEETFENMFEGKLRLDGIDKHFQSFFYEKKIIKRFSLYFS